MKKMIGLGFIAAILFAAPANAGVVNFTDGGGSWRPVNCIPPTPLDQNSPAAEQAANDLNARIVLHNKFMDDAQKYMQCLSQESQADANSVSQAITAAAQTEIDKTKKQMDSSAAWLYHMQNKD